VADFIYGLQAVRYSGEPYDAAVAAANNALLDPYLRAGGDFQLPPGEFYLQGEQNMFPGLDKSFILRGATDGRTILHAGPDTSPASATIMFDVTGSALTAQFKNLDLIGHNAYTYGVDPGFSDTVESYGIRGTRSAIICEDVTAKLWFICLKPELGGSVTLRGCRIGGRGGGVVQSEGTNPSSFTADNCDVALDADNARAVGQVHNFYINGGVDIEVTNNRFTRAGYGTYAGFGLLAGFGGSATPTQSRIISGNRFSGMARHLFLGATGDSLSSNNVFDSSADAAMAVIHMSPHGLFRSVNDTFIAVPTYTADQYGILDDLDTTGATRGTVDSPTFIGRFVYAVRRTNVGSTGALQLRHATVPQCQAAMLGSDAGCGVIDAWRSDFSAVGLLCSPTPNDRVRFSECTLGGAGNFSGIG
jgi:hypothetical protein